jgi:DNA-binding NtrC family response regulator
VILLANHFLELFSKQNNLAVKSFSKGTIKEMLSYPWPGNIRELKSVVERAALLCETQKIEVDDLIFK